MTEEEIIKNNILIAEFIGGARQDNGWNYCLSDFGIRVIGGYGFYEGFDLKFHVSWDWLIPVIKEITNKLINNSTKPTNSKSYINWIESMGTILCRGDIDVAYNKVINFIEQYSDSK